MRITKTNLILLISLVVTVLLFIVMGVAVYKAGEPLGIDIAIRDFCYNIRGEKGGFFYWLFRILTELGNIYFIIAFIIFVLIYTRCDNRFFLLTIGVLLTTLINVGLKDAFARIRPDEALMWMEEDSFSFPSGHATNVGFMMPFVAYCIFTGNYKKAFKIISCIVTGLIAVIVMISRPMLGVHYFTDIIAGFLSGLMISILCMLALNFLNKYNILSEGLISKGKKNEKDNSSTSN